MSWRNELTVGILRAERLFLGTANGGLGEEIDTIEWGLIDGVTPGTGEAMKALSLDINSDLTSGINDFNIGGDLVVVGDMTLDDLDLTGDLTVDGGQITVGVQDVQEGAIFVYGAITGSIVGGKIELQTAADHDTTIDSYSVRVASDDLQIGPSTDQDSLMYDGTSEQWTITGPNGLLINAGAVGPSALVVGEEDVSGSSLTLHGMETGETDGASIIMHAATDHDGDNAYYKIHVASDDFVLELADGTDIFKYDRSTALLDIDSGCYFTGEVTFDGNIAGSVDMIGGSLDLGQSAVSVGDLKIYGAPTGSVQGGMIRLQTADDHDTTITEFFIQATSQTLTIGSDIVPDAIEITSSVINLREELYSDHPVAFAGVLDISDANVTEFTVGANAATGGIITVAGGATGETQGGQLLLEVNDDDDTTITHYAIQATGDNLYIGPSNDTNALSYDGGSAQWDVGATMYFDGTTLDCAGPVKMGSATVWNFELGNGVLNGILICKGSPTGGSEGGALHLETSDDNDGVVNEFVFQAMDADLLIGTLATPDLLKYDTGSAVWKYTSAGCDIYGDQTFEWAGDVNFGSATMNDFSVGTGIGRGIINMVGQATGSSLGGRIELSLADDDDATNALFYIEANGADLVIGSVANALMTFDAAGDQWMPDKDFYFDGKTLDVAGTFKLDGVTVSASAAELNYNDLTTLGTGEASKVLTLDASGHMTGIAGDWGLTSVTSVDLAVGALELAGVAVTPTAAELNILDNVVGPTVTLTSETGGSTSCVVQVVFNDAAGNPMATIVSGTVYFSDDAAGLTIDGVDTSVAVATNGALMELDDTGHSVFQYVSSAAGLLGFTITSAAASYYACFPQPDGSVTVVGPLICDA